jgi:hypothetical protein
MEMLDAVHDAGHQFHGLGVRRGLSARFFEPVPERAALGVFADDDHVFLEREHVEDRHDVWVAADLDPIVDLGLGRLEIDACPEI